MRPLLYQGARQIKTKQSTVNIVVLVEILKSNQRKVNFSSRKTGKQSLEVDGLVKATV